MILGEIKRFANPRFAKYRLMWNLYPKLGIVNKFPPHIDIESTNYCNLDCIMCGRSLMKDKYGLMDWSIFQKVIYEAVQNDCRSIKLNWRGEPLVHPLLPEMVRFAKIHKILDVQINTNGQLLSYSRAKELRDAGLDRIIISIDGTTKEEYEKIRIKGDFDKLLDNVKSLHALKNRPLVRIQTIRFPQNQEKIQRFKDFWGKWCDDVKIKTIFDPLSGLNKEFSRKDRPRCTQLWQRLVVSWQGDIHPCCVDWGSQKVLGNIKDTTLEFAWHASWFDFARAAHRRKEGRRIKLCSKCDNFSC